MKATKQEQYKYKHYTVTARFLKEVDHFPNEGVQTNGNHNQFVVTVKNATTSIRRSFVFTGSVYDWQMGKNYMDTDDLKRALACLLEDSNVQGLSFSDFCDEYGYDTDSRKAYRIYEACKKQAVKVSALGLDPVDDYNALND
jgi:hypothetical protein